MIFLYWVHYQAMGLSVTSWNSFIFSILILKIFSRFTSVWNLSIWKETSSSYPVKESGGEAICWLSYLQFLNFCMFAQNTYFESIIIIVGGADPNRPKLPPYCMHFATCPPFGVHGLAFVFGLWKYFCNFSWRRRKNISKEIFFKHEIFLFLFHFSTNFT